MHKKLRLFKDNCYASIEYGIKEKITFAPSCVILKGKNIVEK